MEERFLAITKKLLELEIKIDKLKESEQKEAINDYEYSEVLLELERAKREGDELRERLELVKREEPYLRIAELEEELSKVKEEKKRLEKRVKELETELETVMEERNFLLEYGGREK